MVIDQYDVFLVNLDPALGHEIQKTRPCLVISPGAMNRNIGTVIAAPMTTKSRNYPTRVAVRGGVFGGDGKASRVVGDLEAVAAGGADSDLLRGIR